MIVSCASLPGWQKLSQYHVALAYVLVKLVMYSEVRLSIPVFIISSSRNYPVWQKKTLDGPLQTRQHTTMPKNLLTFILITNAYVRYDHGDCCLQQIKGTLSKPALLQFSIPVCRHRGWLHGDRDSNQNYHGLAPPRHTVKCQYFIFFVI